MRDGVGGAGRQGSQIFLCTDRAVSYYCCALQAQAAMALGSGPLAAWDGPDSLRLGREQVAHVVTQHPSHLAGTAWLTRDYTLTELSCHALRRLRQP